jgi:hypothetical protein
MPNDKPKHTHGGKRLGAGRHHLDGSPPGEGVAAVKVTVTVPPDVAEYLRRLGNGNRSLGVRLLVAEARKEQQL